MQNNYTINFVKKDKRLLRLQSRRIYIIQSLSLFILAAYGLVLILVFSYSTFLSYRIKNTEKSIAGEISSIQKLTPLESKYVVLKQKSEAAVSMTKSMYRYQDLIQAIFQLVPSDLYIDGFSVDENNDIKFSATTLNPMSINNFIDKVKQYNSNQTSNELVKARIMSVNVGSDGKYTLNILLRVLFKD